MEDQQSALAESCPATSWSLLLTSPSYSRYLFQASLLVVVLALLFGTFAGLGRYWTSAALALVFLFALSAIGEKSGLNLVPEGAIKLQSMGLLLGLALVLLGHAYGYQRAKTELHQRLQEEGTPREVFDRHLEQLFGDDSVSGFRGYFSYLAARGYDEEYQGVTRGVEGLGVWLFWFIQGGMFVAAGYQSGTLATPDSRSSRVHSTFSRPSEATPFPLKSRDGLAPGLSEEERSQRFFWACRDGDLAMVEQMLRRNVDLEYRSGDFKETPLLSAARFKRYRIVDSLLEAGADPLALDDWENSILHKLAVDDGGHRFLASMVERGVELDSPGRTGRTPLFFALSCAATANANFFLERGSDVHTVADRGETALAALLSGPESRWRGKDDDRVELLRRLIDLGADPTAADAYGTTPIHLAANLGSAELVSALAEAGASLQASSNRGATPLQIVAANERTRSFADYLLEMGAELDVFSAVCLGRHRDVERLLRQDPSTAHLTDASTLGSVLSRAVHDSDLRMAEILLAHGADPNARALHDTVLHCAIEHRRSLELVTLLVEHGASVDGLGQNGLPALAAAASTEQPKIVEYLLSRGADPNHAWNERGLTVLGSARSEQVRSMLLTAGARDR